tara:strand:- start:19945 stop:20094 length:150 start_codon:yes stop_codon:yes gene_type:complete
MKSPIEPQSPPEHFPIWDRKNNQDNFPDSETEEDQCGEEYEEYEEYQKF